MTMLLLVSFVAVLSAVSAADPAKKHMLKCYTCLQVVEGKHDPSDEVKECHLKNKKAMNATLQECGADEGCGTVKVMVDHGKSEIVESLEINKHMSLKLHHGTFIVRTCVPANFCSMREEFINHEMDCTVCDHTACNPSTMASLSLPLFSVMILPFMRNTLF